MGLGFGFGFGLGCVQGDLLAARLTRGLRWLRWLIITPCRLRWLIISPWWLRRRRGEVRREVAC